MPKKPLKVLMFGWEFPPHNSGGLGTACYGLTRALSDESLDVELTFVLPRKQDAEMSAAQILFADSFPGNVKVRTVDSVLSPYMDARSYKDYYQLLSSGDRDFYGSSLFEEVELYTKRAEALVKGLDFDVIHAHDWLSFGAALKAREISNKPLVVHVHATEFDRTGGNGVNSHVYSIERKSMEVADKVIAVSNFTKQIITERYSIPKEKVEVVHNGIDMAEHEENIKRKQTPLRVLKEKGKDVVLFVGRITLQKGLEYFLYAAKRVLEYRPNTLFVVAGSGDMAEQMIRLSAHLGISKNVIFAGFLRGEELEYVYSAADLFVMPSVSEPFGLTALEAIERGAPVLLSKQSGVSEVVSHALRVDFWDTDAMADKMISVLSYESLGNELRRNAHKELGRITWANAAEKCCSIYSMLTAQSLKSMK